MAFLAAEHEVVGAAAKECAVIQQLALIVAPGGVMDMAHFQLRHIADHQAVETGFRILACDPVFHHGREVIDAGLVADGGIFHGLVIIGEHRGVAAP